MSNLVTARLSRRIFADLVDRLIFIFGIAILAAGFALLGNDMAIPGYAVAFVAIIFLAWAFFMRVLDHGATIGMSILNLQVEPCSSRFKSGFLNRYLFWINVTHGDTNDWRADKNEEVQEAILWRNFFKFLVTLTSALIGAAIAAVAIMVSRLGQFAISKLRGNEFDLLGSDINSPDTVMLALAGVPLLVLLSYVFLISFGPLFALGEDRRTLADHFLGIRFVEADLDNSNLD